MTLPIRDLPRPSLKLLFFPQRDTDYVHFAMANDVPFDPLAAGFSAVNAWYLADAALLAYWPPDEAPHRFARGGFTDTRFFSNRSTQCYVASNDRAAIVTFRGTQIDQLQDAIADADVKRVTWDGEGRVHRGFLGGLDAVWQPLDDHLRTLDGRTIWTTGHSLGAALATLAARRWTKNGRAIGGVYTVGSPRIGDRDFANGVNRSLPDNCFRYVNGQDGVTNVPFEQWGYVHAGEERSFTGSRDPLIDHTPRRYATLIWNDLATLAAGS